MTTLVISQPMYFAWPGFMAQLAMADVLVWLDDVQFSKGSFTNRIQLVSGNKPKWMTLALKSGGSKTIIKDLEASEKNSFESQRDLLRHSLQSYEYKEESLRIYDKVVKVSGGRIVDTIMYSSEIIATSMNVLPPRIFRSSDIRVEGSSSLRVLAIAKEIHANRYLTGHGAAKYLDHTLFEENNIRVEYMKYQFHPWKQSAPTFSPYVSSLDLIAATSAIKANQCLCCESIYWKDFMAETT